MMQDPRTAPERIDLRRADDMRDVVHRAVACLAQGGVLAAPMDVGYGLAASALRPEAVARLRALRGSDAPLTLGLNGPGEVADWVPALTATGRRLARRAWPGPITLVFGGDVGYGLVGRLPREVRATVLPGATIGLRQPAHAVLREVARLLPGPLVLGGARAGGADQPAATPDPLAARPGLDMLLDDGPIATPGRTTAIRIEGDAWEVIRPGVVDPEAIARMAGAVLLFVCTGNTCRSPMAEAIARHLLAERRGCEPEALAARGVLVVSAGLAADPGAGAAPEAVEIIGGRGGSLRAHASQPVTPDLIGQADWIVAMTRGHRDALLDDFPEAADRVRLLHRRGGDIPDPIGSGREVYRRTAEAIEEHLNAMLDEIGI